MASLYLGWPLVYVACPHVFQATPAACGRAGGHLQLQGAGATVGGSEGSVPQTVHHCCSKLRLHQCCQPAPDSLQVPDQVTSLPSSLSLFMPHVTKERYHVVVVVDRVVQCNPQADPVAGILTRSLKKQVYQLKASAL